MILNSFRFNSGPSFGNQYSMNFDGIDESIIFADNPTYASTLKHSISVWFKCTTLNSGTTYLFDTGNQRLGFISSTSQLRYQFTKSPTQDDIRVSGLTITDGQWHHVLATFDGSTRIAQVFYDGSLVFTKNPTNCTATNGQLYNAIGAIYVGTARWFNGSIDEVGFWHDTDQSANISSIWNGGTPNDLNTLPTPPTNYVRMGDGATWDGINWNLPDLGVMNGTPVSRNMEEGDRQTDTP